MKDFIGNVLEVGDVVAVTPKGYRGLIKATVASFTPKMVRLQYFDTFNHLNEYLVPPCSTVKIERSQK